MFWVNPWIPQIEVLAHPATKVGITHGGLGGSFEFIYTNTVPLLLPHFGDQGFNADNFINRGAGLCLFDTKIGKRNAEEKHRSILDPIFTANDVTTKLETLLTDNNF